MSAAGNAILGTSIWDGAAFAVMAIVAGIILWTRVRRTMRKFTGATYHIQGDAWNWGTASFLGRKEMRICPDCKMPAHDLRAMHDHNEYHNHLYTLEDRLAAVEELLAEKIGGGPAEEVAVVPWDGVSGELVEHAGAVDVTVGEIEARADEPEPEQVLAFRERFKDLIRP